MLHLDRPAKQGKLKPVLVVATQPAHHVAGRDNPPRLPVHAIVRCGDEPEMLGTAQGPGPVLRLNTKDLTWALRIDPEHRRRPAIGSYDEVPHAQRSDRLPTGRCQYALVHRLRPAAHERQRGDLDDVLLEVRRDALGVEHVVQRVEQRAQVGVDLRHQVAGQEAEALARLDGGAGQDDPVDLAPAERGRGHRDGQEGLAGAGRADAEGDRVDADRVDVALLVDGLGGDLRRAVAPDDVLEDPCRRLVLVERSGDRA